MPRKRKKQLKDYFVKVCVNRMQSYEIEYIGREAVKVSKKYKRKDLTELAEESFNKGEDYFYVEPVNPDDKYGPVKLSKPLYEYRCNYIFTEEEFAEITGEKE